MDIATAADLSSMLRALALAHPQHIAIAGAHDTLSCAALDAHADAWAAAFQGAGYRPGAHIALLAGNGPTWMAVAFGVWRAGLTLVPVSTFVTTRELAEILTHADAHMLLVQPQLDRHALIDRVRDLPALPQLREIIVLSDGPPRPYQSAAAFRELHKRTPPKATMRAVTAPDPESIACILYTSGTTGRPKGVMLSHRAIMSTVRPTAMRGGLDGTDSLLSTLPLFWVAGLVIRALPTLASGCALIFLETFTADAAIAALRRHRPTALHLRPPQVGQILAHPHFEPALLENVSKGGGRSEWYAPHLPNARLITGYGMTETAGYVTCLDWHDAPDVRRTQIGTPLPGVALRMVDAIGQPCTPGESGEVRVRGPGMFSGYYKEPPGAGIDTSGWFATGDVGCLDAAGTFHFAGRRKDLLRIKGINVSPVEVEGVLGTHPGLEAAYVVGLPPDGLEQRLVALIVPRHTPVEESELRAFTRRTLSHYKCPETYIVIDRTDVPLGSTAKPQRAALAALAARKLGEAWARSDT